MNIVLLLAIQLLFIYYGETVEQYELGSFTAVTVSDPLQGYHCGYYSVENKIYCVRGYVTTLDLNANPPQSQQILTIGDADAPNFYASGTHQINYKLYMIREYRYIAVYDMENKAYDKGVYNSQLLNGHKFNYGACMNVYGDNYIIVTGGTEGAGNSQNRKSTILDMGANQWTSGPDMVNTRQGHECAVANDRVYVLMNTVEYMELPDNMNDFPAGTWNLLTETLINRPGSYSAVGTHKNYIYYLGRSALNKYVFEVIDATLPNSDSNSIFETLMQPSIPDNSGGDRYGYATTLITKDRFYIFNGADNQFEYAQFAFPLSREPFDFITPVDPCENVVCPSNKVCVDGSCQRDCAAFQIDEFLVDCSAEFEGNENEIQILTDKVATIEGHLGEGGSVDVRLDDIEADIGSNDDEILIIQGQLADNGEFDSRIDALELETGVADDITRLDQAETNIVHIQGQLANNGEFDVRLDALELETDVTNINGITRLDQAETRLNALETKTQDGGPIDTRLDALEVHFAKISAHSQGVNVINDGVEKVNSFISTQSKDMLLIFLLTLNTLLIVCGAISCILWNKSREKYQQYNNTKVYSSDDENQQLQS